MTGGGQARCLTVPKMSSHTDICAPGYHLNFPSHIVAVPTEPPGCTHMLWADGGASGGSLPEVSVEEWLYGAFSLGFIFLYVSCKCHGTERSFCMQARAYITACCWCPVPRIQPRSAILSAAMWQDPCVSPFPPGAGLGSTVKAQK